MNRRFIPQAQIELSAVGIGAMSFADFYGPVTEDQAHAILDKARHAGINHIDTAKFMAAGIQKLLSDTTYKPIQVLAKNSSSQPKRGLEPIQRPKNAFSVTNLDICVASSKKALVAWERTMLICSTSTDAIANIPLNR